MATSNSSESSSGKESFDEFRTSFSCGSRNDLLFKWMKTASEELADEFLQELLDLTGNLIDDGNTQPIVEAIVRAQPQACSGAGRF